MDIRCKDCGSPYRLHKIEFGTGYLCVGCEADHALVAFGILRN